MVPNKSTNTPNKTLVKKAVNRLKEVGTEAAFPCGQNKLQDATGKLPLFDSWSPRRSTSFARDSACPKKQRGVFTDFPNKKYFKSQAAKGKKTKKPLRLSPLIRVYSDSAELIGEDDIGMWPTDRLINWPTSALHPCGRQAGTCRHQPTQALSRQ